LQEDRLSEEELRGLPEHNLKSIRSLAQVGPSCFSRCCHLMVDLISTVSSFSGLACKNRQF
jgi:hypothetical protein